MTDEFKKRNGQPNSVISFRNQICHCLFTKKMAIVVPIPLHVSPEFMTEIVILRWRLHFEFTTSKEPLEGQVQTVGWLGFSSFLWFFLVSELFSGLILRLILRFYFFEFYFFRGFTIFRFFLWWVLVLMRCSFCDILSQLFALDDVHGDTMWQGPFQMKTNGMCWDLPMKVLPTVPALAESATTTDCAVKIVF